MNALLLVTTPCGSRKSCPDHRRRHHPPTRLCHSPSRIEHRIGNLGFHAIPLKVSDNSICQTSDELGTRLSGGCQRQANEDAAFLWEFAPVGTTIVVT